MEPNQTVNFKLIHLKKILAREITERKQKLKWLISLYLIGLHPLLWDQSVTYFFLVDRYIKKKTSRDTRQPFI